MGWTVLYIAFGIVALWLLSEVLLQNKARLRWRVLAFAGFLVVVLGVLIPSVYVIVLGTIGFAVGQTYVTLSFRRGFETGWAIGPGAGGASRRRKDDSPKAADREPALEVSGLEYEPAAPAAEPVSVYAPEPLPEETAQYGYGLYDDPADGAGQDRAGRPDAQTWADAFDAYPGYGPQPDGQDVYAAATRDPYPAQNQARSGQDDYASGYQGQSLLGDQDIYGQQYDWTGAGTGQQQYAAYSDPYVGTTGGGQQYGAYDGFGGPQQHADPYAQQYAGDTPPGGVWVPQQRERDGEQTPREQPRAQGFDPGFNDQQYRF
ncbi:MULTISPECIES: hypothetical protein [unclassified Streptomyces]|uniref:hypothetical protein n=1 Tax=unclassified Streptomyces TaxID=2593676 RepID=UPI00380D9076